MAACALSRPIRLLSPEKAGSRRLPSPGSEIFLFSAYLKSEPIIQGHSTVFRRRVLPQGVCSKRPPGQSLFFGGSTAFSHNSVFSVAFHVMEGREGAAILVIAASTRIPAQVECSWDPPMIHHRPVSGKSQPLRNESYSSVCPGKAIHQPQPYMERCIQEIPAPG